MFVNVDQASLHTQGTKYFKEVLYFQIPPKEKGFGNMLFFQKYS